MAEIKITGGALNALLSVEAAATKPRGNPKELRRVRIQSTRGGVRSLASTGKLLAETVVYGETSRDNGFDIQIEAVHAPVLRKRFIESLRVHIQALPDGEIVFSDNLGEFKLDPLPEPEKVTVVIEMKDQPTVEHENTTLLNVEDLIYETDTYPEHSLEDVRKYTAVSPEYFGLLNKIQLIANDDKNLPWEMQQLWQANDEARVSNFVKFCRKGIGASNTLLVPIADRFEQATIFEATDTDAAA